MQPHRLPIRLLLSLLLKKKSQITFLWVFFLLLESTLVKILIEKNHSHKLIQCFVGVILNGSWNRSEQLNAYIFRSFTYGIGGKYSDPSVGTISFLLDFDEILRDGTDLFVLF
jgi:hypothetical protein